LGRRNSLKKLDGKLHIFHVLEGDAIEIHDSLYGSVGQIFRGEGMEAVWVKKQGDEVDPDWFSQPMVDLILVMQGCLKMEYERSDLPGCVLEPGDLVVLPANTRCRAYRWPRDAQGATIFLAVYPANG
jgi:hypothetical protein